MNIDIFDDAIQVGLKLSRCWTNTLVTGVAFLSETSNCIGVAGYDCNTFLVVDLEDYM